MEQDEQQVKPSDLLIKERPCCCGCGGTVKSKNKKVLFLPAHDSKLKALLGQVSRGEKPTSAIPEEALTNYLNIGFLRTSETLSNVMATVVAEYKRGGE